MKGDKMEELTIRLENIKDSYYGFIVAVITYVKKKSSRLDAVSKYLDENPAALSSDVLDFISVQDDFYEDSAYAYAEVS